MDFTAVRLVGVGLGFSLKKRLEIMTELKALGKKPIVHSEKQRMLFISGKRSKEFYEQAIVFTCEQRDHFKQALLEAADEIEHRDRRFFTFPWIGSLVEKLRISAGVGKE